MKLPGVKKQNLANKKVLLRTNFDVPLTSDGRVADETRIEESLATIKCLLSQKAEIVIISHLDRPGGKSVPGLSLKSVAERLKVMLPKTKIDFAEGISGEKTKRMLETLKPGEILFLENLRFDPGEEANNSKFAQSLAALADFYVNDAFACSHRQHASIVGVPQFLPAALGLDFLEEIKILGKVLKNPQRPVVVILGGVKKSKMEAAKKLATWVDYILVGGELVEYEEVSKMISRHPKILGSLAKQGEDITIETVKKFKKVIAQAKTIIWTGPMGAFENQKFEKGTKEIAQAVVASGAYTVVGGGDTEAALTKFGLVKKVDYISSGGGAMLSFLADGTLPGIEAIRRKND
ncbi:MAG TPA: phosphoglycerate kinase [Nevskiaceae bacterium]|nr:phosphoglycerate kinase [Nevskiaceae bacterium]